MTSALVTARLRLTPLDPADAPTMVAVLADPDLYAFTGGEPPTLGELDARYLAQVAGPQEADDERWLNWIVRLADTGQPVGFVQATVRGGDADVAWVIGTDWQRHGFAREAATAMCRWLRGRGVSSITAHIDPSHDRSEGVAAAIGMRPTGAVDADGEQIWTLASEQR